MATAAMPASCSLCAARRKRSPGRRPSSPGTRPTRASTAARRNSTRSTSVAGSPGVGSVSRSARAALGRRGVVDAAAVGAEARSRGRKPRRSSSSPSRTCTAMRSTTSPTARRSCGPSCSPAWGRRSSAAAGCLRKPSSPGARWRGQVLAVAKGRLPRALRYKPVILADEDAGDFCDPFGFCQGWLHQVEIAGGVVVRF